MKKRLTPKDLYLNSMGRKYSYIKAFCECDLPNKELYEFNGKLLVSTGDSDDYTNAE